MSARRPASRNGNSPRQRTIRRRYRWPRIRSARLAARCRCPTSSRTITASPKRAPRSPPRCPARPSEATNSGRRVWKDPKAAEPRPLFEAPSFPLVLPNARTRNGVGQTVKDLSEDPYAGAEVTLTLTAKDEAGNEGKSEPFNMRLPERLFTQPLGRALIEHRRMPALDANQNAEVSAALDALMIAPELFTPQAGQYLGLHNVTRQLEAARTDGA